MKSSTLDALLVAKSILGKTKSLVNSGDKHSATAGIILLQDFVELVVLAALDELDGEEQRNLESKSFDELLGELKKAGVSIYKSGTIKALNKQRVISKHYGQLAEPAAVVNYFNVSVLFADNILEQVIGRKLNEVFLTSLLSDGVVKDSVNQGVLLSEQQQFLEALIELRKAFYSAYEIDYCIYEYRNDPVGLNHGLLYLGGRKAHYFTKNKGWIDLNVKKPLDYMQVNHEQLKTDCMELGISTADVENFRRLTPELVKTSEGSTHTQYDTNFAANELTSENFNYCLDVLIDFLLKKQALDSSRKWPKREKSVPAPPIYIGKPVYEKPDQGSKILGYVPEGYFYNVHSVVSGFDCKESYLNVHLYPKGAALEFDFAKHIFGYLLS